MVLVGFSGKMGSGKSTAIHTIMEAEALSGGAAVNIKFAQPLYDIQEFIYRCISSVVKRDSSFVKDRKLLQWLGTDWGRDTISKTLWIDLWKSKVGEQSGNTVIVCDDVRFDNEAKAIKDLGGLVVVLDAGKTSDRINTDNGIKGHSSEQGLDPALVDITLENKGDLQQFVATITKFHREFISRE